MIGSLLEGVAQTGMVELGDVQLASYLAETMFTKQPYFRKGLPALVAFPPNCSNANCYVRYDGQFSVDAIVDWMATDIIGLPRILYHSKESLAKFIVTSGRHKVKVICFSKTGERAAPFIRKAAKDYQAEASFAFVLWKEPEFSLWWNMFGVESAPAFVFLKDTYSKPFVYHELPQLRSVTSMELGCDARGFSRAGNDTLTWYCLVLVGRAGRTMAQMRETMYRVRDMLMTGDDSDYARKVNASVPMVAATAVKENRLTFTWLDGDVQLKYCQFFLDSEFYKSCGPRRYENDIDVPQIFIVRYLRNSSEDNVEADKWKHLRDQYMGKDANAASQLIARYTGSDDVKEIIQWISHIIERGDTREYPYFTFTSPELVAEDSVTIWSKSQGILPSRESIKRKLKKLYFYISDLVTDPRIGPSFLLGACLSFATIWLQKNRTIQSATPGDDTTDSARRRSNRKGRARSSTHGEPSSITDEEPKDAHQLLSSGSDSE
uniref:Uncharacterized protein n=1 Tax=Musa acuminata subsp. malaccensis TaxID=214687 RepID=A0A804I675_MUSAM